MLLISLIYDMPMIRSTMMMSLPHSTKVIGTHSGTFQADEALGAWLLRQLPTYYNSPVIRSRDPDVLATCDIVIDIGGIYDHTKLLYDHHQRDYDERFDVAVIGGGGMMTSTKTRCTKLSASGLVYRHYGRDVITAHYPTLLPEAHKLEWTYVKMNDSFMEAIDAIDTGVEPVPSNIPGQQGVELLYHDSTRSILYATTNLLNRWQRGVGDRLRR
jgi:uncharacterized UPF0160 family protein